ncbi:unnamed protein product [Cyprideis torosa]|uniref:Uncharacterized protein n=1 Tax=Cyprideis torosa TaxID=163714 RepID=A0A7R8WMI7_9CRUS|nr:unnamed protein product [Cyprideis torosa]CAG0905331.1 unnamed protein product [Cyprideis torosa]
MFDSFEAFYEPHEESVDENLTPRERFLDFYYDVTQELKKFGVLRHLVVCSNTAPHLKGSLFAQFSTGASAREAQLNLAGRWFGGNQLQVVHVRISSWREAVCGMFQRGACQKGPADCPYLHPYRNPRGEYTPATGRIPITSESPVRSERHERPKDRDDDGHRRREKNAAEDQLKNVTRSCPTQKNVTAYQGGPENVTEDDMKKESVTEGGRKNVAEDLFQEKGVTKDHLPEKNVTRGGPKNNGRRNLSGKSDVTKDHFKVKIVTKVGLQKVTLNSLPKEKGVTLGEDPVTSKRHLSEMTVKMAENGVIESCDSPEVRYHEVKFIEPTPIAVNCLAVNKDGCLLAVARLDATVELWDIRDPSSPIFAMFFPPLPGNDPYVDGIAWLGRRLFATGLHGFLVEYDFSNPLQAKFRSQHLTGGGAFCLDVVEVGRTGLLAMGTEKGCVSMG